MSKTKIESNNLSDNVVTTPNIAPATVTDSDLSSDAENLNLSSPQLASSLDLSSKTLTIPDASLAPFAADSNTQAFNVGLLGFKHAVNEGLTIFNLVDGVVDEFHDESGVDTPENSNALYDSSSDFYTNQVGGDIPAPQVGRQVLTGHTFENQGEGTYTVEPTVTAVDLLIVGGGGGGHWYSNTQGSSGAGGGGLVHVTDYEVTPGSTISYIIGSGGDGRGSSGYPAPGTGISGYYVGPAGPNTNFPPSITSPYSYGTAGALGSHKYVYEAGSDAPYAPQVEGVGFDTPTTQVGSPPGPSAFSGEYGDPNPGNFHPHNIDMGFGRDTVWNDGQPDSATTTDESPTSRTYFSKLTGMGGGLSKGYADGRNNFGGSGGGTARPASAPSYGPDQGGEGIQNLVHPAGPGITPGAPEEGDMPSLTGNVVGSFGADGGQSSGPNENHGAGGGGSGEAGHPGPASNGGDGLTFTMADGSTPIAYGAGGGGSGGGEGGNEGVAGGNSETAHADTTGGGTVGRGNGGAGHRTNVTGVGIPQQSGLPGGSGTIIVVESRQLVTNTSMTLISDTFTANTTPTTARIVLFAEISDDLNTDITASATRDNTTFNAITLTDEGFQAGSSGIKIFTGSTPLTGSASPQVQLRWKVVGSSMTGENKIHGVALQWA